MNHINMSGFETHAVGSGETQHAIDQKVEELSSVLEHDDPLQTLAWLAEYSTIASRYVDKEGIDLRLDSVVTQLDEAGYGDSFASDDPHAEALEAIQRTHFRIKDGLAPTGFEQIFAERIITGANADTVDIA